tara:strand:+ start:771 stop:1340 length:570 start_codon:yes stop_codon:yes gene_type:complete
MELEKHLGGHGSKTHIDKATLQWLKDIIKVKSFLDIGCGPGGMVNRATTVGLHARGIDGDYTLTRAHPERFILHDFSKERYISNEKFDIAWSVEFLEHVYKQYIPNYMPAFQLCKNAIITYAPIGWPGHHHVNCQDEPYWIDLFEQYGFKLDKEKTEYMRKISSLNVKKFSTKKAFIKNRGLFFVNARF